MTVNEFEKIKNEIETAKTKAAEAKGRMKAIQDAWEEEYGFTDLESAEKKLAELKADAEAKMQKRNELMEKLEKSYDWWGNKE